MSSPHGHSSRVAHQEQHVLAMLAQANVSPPSGGLSVSPVFARRHNLARLKAKLANCLGKLEPAIRLERTTC